MATPINRTSPTAADFSIVTVIGIADGGADFDVVTSTAKLWTLEIDNTLNAIPVYVKLWWLPVASVVVGSTAPDSQYVGPASTKQTYTFSAGPVMGNGGAMARVTWACVLEPGTTGSTPPTASVDVRLLYQSLA
jgi:hypothetical protein|tara:strand:+ start:281 stop:682 length:402 start_codon:yes stop_codon:yes gene_type:complete